MSSILLKDFEFNETATHVYLTIPWPCRISSKTADIYANDLYLKVNSPPHFFEADLLHNVNETDSIATIDERKIKFSLVKV
jgi:hypothetical protein